MFKTYINKYIESRVVTYITIIERMYVVRNCSIDELLNLETINITKATLCKYIDELYLILDEEIFLKKNEVYFLSKKSLKEIKAIIYKTSPFLNMLIYCMMPSTKSFNEYIYENYLSRAKAYELKKRVKFFLQDCNCEDIGENSRDASLKKMLLTARLELEYGLEIISQNIKDEFIPSIQLFIKKIPSFSMSIDRQLIFQHLILQTITLKITFKDKHKFNELFQKQQVDKQLGNEFKIFFKKNTRFFYKEKTQIGLFFFLFFNYSPISSKSLEEKKTIYLEKLESVLECPLRGNGFVSCLLTDVIKLFYFPSYFKLAMDIAVKSAYNPDLFEKIFQLLEQLGLSHSFDFDVLCFFCAKLEELSLWVSQPKILIFSQSYTEYLNLYSHLKKFCHLNVNLSDIWFYDVEYLKFFQCKTSFIVTEVKYVDWFDGWNRVHFVELPFSEQDIQSLNKNLLSDFYIL